MKQLALTLLLVGCGSRELAGHAIARETKSAARAADARRWIAGDVHMHVSPPDDPNDVVMNVEQIAEAAMAAGLDFVVLTPHLWGSRWGSAFRDEWATMASAANATAKPTLIPGVEWTTRDGHFTVAGVDVTALRGPFLAAADAAGAFISVNHPFAVPTKIPGVRASHLDMSYRAWTERRAAPDATIDGAEVWNVPLSLANLISRPGGRTGEERAWSELNRVVHDDHRRVTAVGGTDNHRMHVIATTWVLALDATASSILDALARGATCIGGPEAGTLRARGADDHWVRIGESVAARTITLAWDGLARLYIDDVDTGEHAGGFVHDTGDTLHTYRIVVGGSRCGFIYANLSG